MPDAAEADALLDGPFGRKLMAKLPEKGLIGLGFWENGFRQISNNRRPITKAEDIDGLKLRVIQNPLFIDTFTNFFEPEVGQAAVRLLTAAGCRVTPVAPGCCGRPGLSKGVPGAGPRALALAEQLAGCPGDLVGIEPSCLLTLRDEYPDLLRDDKARIVAEHAMLIEELLISLHGRGELAVVGSLALRCEPQSLDPGRDLPERLLHIADAAAELEDVQEPARVVRASQP